MPKTLFQLGQQAHANDIGMPAHDAALMNWLKANTSGEVGSAIPHIEEWYKGFNAAVDAELEKMEINHDIELR